MSVVKEIRPGGEGGGVRRIGWERRGREERECGGRGRGGKREVGCWSEKELCGGEIQHAL